MPDELQNEINDVVGIEPTEPVAPSPPVEHTPVVPPATPPPEVLPQPAAPAEPPDAPAPASVEPPVVPSTPAPVVPPVEPQALPSGPTMEDVMKVNEQLRLQIEQMAKSMGGVAPAAQQPSAPVSPAPAAPPVVQPGTPIKFVESEEGLDEVLKNVDNFNAFMDKVVTNVREETLRHVAAAIPKVDVSAEVNSRMAVNEFFAANKDLEGMRSYVGYMAQQIASQHPDWSLADIMAGRADANYGGLATAVRGSLGIVAAPQPVVPIPPAVETPVAPTPGLLPGTGARPVVAPPSSNTLQDQINDLIG
jgi:hypothetical protein